MGQTNPSSLANLKAGDMTGFDRDEKGRITTSRAEIGRQNALSILCDPEYQASLRTRMIAGEGGAIEVWLWRIGHGDPPKQRDDDVDEQARFAKRREAMQKFMREHPIEAAVLARAVAKGELPPAEVMELVPCELAPGNGTPTGS